MSGTMYGGGAPSTKRSSQETDRTPASNQVESDHKTATDTIKMDADAENVMVGGISSVQSGQVNL